MNYQLDYNLLIKRLLPSFLRKVKMIAWLGCLVTPVTDLYQRFITYRLAKLLEVSYNSQTLIFERLLNTAFSATGIFIENSGNTILSNYIFQLSENERPLFIRNLQEQPKGHYLYTLAEYAGGSWDFVVYVPAALVYDPNKMRATIEKYKLAGTRYTIKKY